MRKVQLRVLVALLVLSSVLIPAQLTTQAQRNGIDTYAVTNARIVTVSGPTIEKGTVVVRDGLIVAVGADVTPPADARVIDGTGLTVYPGLIDANTNLGFPQPTPAPSPTGGGGGFFLLQQQQRTTAPSGPNSTQPAGLQPENSAEDMIQPGGDQIDNERNAGVTTALTAPRSGIWMGQSALINLAGETPQQMIVRAPVAMHVGFTPLRTGNYPGSLMGVFATLRQMLLDAARYREAQQTYERSPRGMRRPSPDKSLEALIPVIEGRMPVVFYADREREIRRSLDLAEEFKLRAIIAGGSEAWKVVDRLQNKNIPVLLSLNFPKRTTAALPEADPEPLRVLRDRVDMPKGAAKLAAAKIPFAFQSGGVTPITDFVANAAKTIENGLTKDQALRAMTIDAAQIFGVADRLGSIETGKIANLTVMRGDLFDRGSRVAHVFIDGRPITLRPAPPTPSRPGPPGASVATPTEGTTTPEENAGSIGGTWSISIVIGGQSLPGTLVLNVQGGTVTGTITSELGTSPLSNGVAEAGGFHANSNATIQGQALDLTITGKVDHDQISGTITSQLGSATYTGTRHP